MPISFGPKSKISISKAMDLAASQSRQIGLGAQSAGVTGLVSTAPSRLVDLRSPETFRKAFIPGSYSVSDLTCVAAARRSGLFSGREIYLLADDPEQLQLCCEPGDLGQGSEMAGWFGADALEEWRNAIAEIGTLTAINSESLTTLLDTGITLVLDIDAFEVEDGCGGKTPRHPGALRFSLNELPLTLDGLPVETSICITANTTALTCYAASLLWNFGFHKLSYVNGGHPAHRPMCGTSR